MKDFDWELGLEIMMDFHLAFGLKEVLRGWVKASWTV